MRGNKPTKSTSIKKMEGVKPSRINDREPLSIHDPDFESGTVGDARKVLKENGVWSSEYAGPANLMGIAYSLAMKSGAILEDQGVMIEDAESGQLIPNPAARVFVQMSGLYKSFAEGFGLTPATRPRVQSAETAVNPLDLLESALESPREAN